MKFEEICALIELVAKKGIPLVEVEQEGVKVRIQGVSQTVQVVRAPESYSGTASSPPAPAPAVAAAPDPGLHIIYSPMVGTFYRAPSPQAEPFVKVGDRVKKGQILCIIEAMKLMNEIESDADGEIITCFPQNAQTVEFGERLYGLKI